MAIQMKFNSTKKKLNKKKKNRQPLVDLVNTFKMKAF